MRNFLKDLNIYGAVLFSRSAHVMHYTIKNLLQYCDKVLIILDNADEETRACANRYAKQYREIELVNSTFMDTMEEQEEKDPLCIYRRFKNLQGEIRNQVFDSLRKKHEAGEKIDLLLWPDHDEIFSNNLPSLLEKFWKSDYKAISMKAVDIFSDMETIHNNGMTCHSRIFKYSSELTAIPYRWGCNYLPLKKNERMGDRYTLIHLSLIKDMIEWREKHWDRRGKGLDKKMNLWRTGKNVIECTPKEIEEVYSRDPDLTVGDYIEGGNKRQPMGVVNASKALKEATDLLDKMQIKYFLAFGTALRLYRDNSFGKDWDIDLIMLGEDFPKFDSNLMAKNGFTDIKIKSDLPKWKNEKGEESKDLSVRTISFKKYGVRIDVDPAHISKDEKERIILKGRKREKFAGVHPKEWFDNEISIKYENKWYSAPSPIDKYLESNYGETWKTPVYGWTKWDQRACRRDYYEIK